jgi:mannose/cellobiose epimerase-like protein (N-acyl-D-glucosamine 2-epimerase family)
MKKIILLSIFFCSFINAQYEIKCDYLKNPELVKGYVDSCAVFWIPSYDTLYGGFFSNVPRNGIVTDLNSKNMLTQSRTAYGMIRAFMLSGDTTYLNFARGALDFMYEHAWDQENKGWFNEMDRQGNKLSGGENNRKWSFMQHYALLGVSAMVDATRNDKDWQFLLDGRAAVDSNLWDSRQDYQGFYNEANLDWSNPNGKGFTPTMDGITTHTLSLYLLTGNQEHKERLLTMADNVIDYLLPAMDQFQYGYPEEFTSDWEPVLSNTYVFTGHLLKSAWCVTRAYLIEPKQEYIDFSTTILEEVLDQGYDHENGGCYKEYDGATGQRYDNNKEWWELEQMFTSGIMNYYISSDERFLQAADETLDFYMKYFVDHTYGEVYQTTNRTGTPTTNSKASYWKAGYHSIELGYYVYLYGNLFLYNAPVTLYYYIQPVDSNRQIILNPLAVEDNKLKIGNVELNGQSYTDFSSTQRELNIPSGTGGIFKVTFEAVPTGIASDDLEIPENFQLYQNYPNPFNPETKIKFSIPDVGTRHAMSLRIYDILGREVATLVNEEKPAGTYTVNFTAGDLSSGVYFYKIQTGKYSATKKMVLTK